MKAKTLLIIVLLATSSLFSAVSSIYSDHKSFTVGDILTVIITESSSAKAGASSQTDRSFNHGFNTEAGKGPLDFIPLSGLGTSAGNSSKGDANTSREGSLKANMTVRIVSIDDNGNLVIQGTKSVLINGEEEITSLEGTVRSQDVSANNTVSSNNIADAKIEYKGKGVVAEASKVGFITRIFNFLF
ncbi:MAG TPA: flagellar basal body L-ring protein FlgH [Candidatus Cloacimonadota bacterium]|jgi:flagellar L-ring protein precursor FlgH|nr:flagellar basal body L-ring protein FlgH [Candidatus Cloacimonadales bacterium]HPY96768.1 flagellar basal body L-ring protein FlgH [Candidatus Cloacimonadota bacterium]HQB41367.1 flagellar basal body L-ring protein FlgH [Candidatus Cloacimonadota bacterium]